MWDFRKTDFFFFWVANKHLVEVNKNIAIWESLIQAEAQIMFQLGDEGNGCWWEKEGEQLHHWKEGIYIGTDNIM